jgi:uncharacterized protein involved in outer membrane biogenesis
LVRYTHMSKRIKIFLISLLVLFTLAASLFIYIYQHVDQLKKYALQEVNYFLKSELAAKQIDVSFWQTFPKVSLALHEVSLSDPLQSKIKGFLYIRCAQRAIPHQFYRNR